MRLSLAIFRRQFQKYACNGLTCTNGIVCESRGEGKLIIGGSADQVFFSLYNNLAIGMNLEEAFDVWCRIVEANVGFKKWSNFLSWNPQPDEWWFGAQGYRYGIRDGVIARIVFEQGLRPVPTNYGARQVLEELQEGMTVEQAREYLLSNIYGARRWKIVYEFDPPVSKESNGEMRSTKLTKDGVYKRSATPPLLSTSEVDVRILRPELSDLAMPDQVQVVLYALTRIWTDVTRRKVNPRVKELVPTYFDFAYRQMRKSQWIRKNPLVYKHLKPRVLRVTKDCCVEVDFDVVGLTQAEYAEAVSSNAKQETSK